MDLNRWLQYILFFLATSNDSVEGIVYNVNQSVIMTGQYVEEEEVEKDKINRMGLWFKPWFYKYVEKFLEKVKMSKNHFFFLIFFKKILLTAFFLSGRNGRIRSNSSFSSSNFFNDIKLHIYPVWVSVCMSKHISGIYLKYLLGKSVNRRECP